MIASPSSPETTSTNNETAVASKPRARLLRFDLPAVIAVPSAPPDEDYRLLFGPKAATIGELRVGALWQSIALDQGKAIALANLLLLVSAVDLKEDTGLTAILPRAHGAAA